MNNRSTGLYPGPVIKKQFGGFRRPSVTTLVLLLGAVCILALDFKSFEREGGSTAQAFLVAGSVFFGGLFVWRVQIETRFRAPKTLVLRALFLWLIYLGFSIIPVLVWDVDLGQYGRVLIPYLLFGLGLLLVLAADQHRLDPLLLIDMLVLGAILSSLWRFFYVVQIAELPMDTMRNQILAPGVLVLLGYGVGGFYLKRRKKLAAICLLIFTIVAILSVTRTLLISLVAVVTGLLAVETARRRAGTALQKTIRYMGSFFLLAVVGYFLAAVLRPDVVQHWETRLFVQETGSGIDITLRSRLAEWKGQVDAISQDISSAVLGRGLGSVVEWDTELLEGTPWEMEDKENWFGGHSSWIYHFYAHGMFVGWIMPYLLMFTLILGYKSSIRREPGRFRDVSVLSFLIYIAYFGASFTVNIFTERYNGIILGVICGQILLNHHLCRLDTAMGRVSRGASPHRSPAR